MEENVTHGQQNMRDDPDVISLLPPRLGSRPEESVNGVLACGESEMVCMIILNRGFDNLPNAEKSLSATSIMLYIR